jgi:hypothetical protein
MVCKAGEEPGREGGVRDRERCGVYRQSDVETERMSRVVERQRGL